MPGKTVCFLTRLVPEPGPTLLREGFTEVRGNFQDRRLSRDELLSGVSGVDALYCLLHDTIDAQIMDAAGPRLKVISNMAVGYDNIDVEAATERGVLVTNTPGVLTNATADLAWALILAASRRVAEGDRLMRRGDFHGWGPNMLVAVGSLMITAWVPIIDDFALRAKKFKRLATDQMSSLFCQGRVHAHDAGFAHHVSQVIHVLPFLTLRDGAGGKRPALVDVLHLHVEASRPSSHSLAYPSHADDPQ